MSARKFGRCDACGQKGARYRTVPARYLCTPCFLGGPTPEPTRPRVPAPTLSQPAIAVENPREFEVPDELRHLFEE